METLEWLRSPERSQPSSEPTTERTPTAGSNTGGIPPPDPVEYGAGQSGPSVYSPFRLGTEAEGRVAEPGLTLSLFYRGQFLSRGPWETPGSFLHPRHSHLQPLSGDYSARAQPASPHREADRHSLSPFSSPISPDAITLWFNLFSVFN